MNKIVDSSWDFRTVDTKPSTHGFHSYPAMMIPQIANRLIEKYASRGAILLDPFCGSGTVLVEAKLAGYDCYGIDINPLALLLSKVKTTPIDPKELKKEYKELISASEDAIRDLNFGFKNVEIPEFFNIDYWFKPNVSKQLVILKTNIEKIEDKDIRDFLLVPFSETVRKVSNTKNGEFKLCRISKTKLHSYNPNVLQIFKEKALNNIEQMSDFYKSAKKNKTIILNEDTRKKTSIADNSVNLIVTSPPYGDSRTTVAYGQFSRLSLQWLGYDKKTVTDVDKISLGGATPKTLKHKLKSPALNEVLKKITEKDEKRAREVLSFYLDLNLCLEELMNKMKGGGRICMVVGNRTVKGIRIPTDEILAELFESLGAKHEETIIRNIPNKRMPSKNSPTNISGELGETMNQEHIVILRA